MARPSALGTIVPIVTYSVMDLDTMKWVNVARGPETPVTEALARQKAGPGINLWVREAGVRPRPV